MTRTIVLAALATVCMVSVARADDWSLTQEFSNAPSASIRVVEPEGYTVTIDGHTDTIPAVFQIANAANYFNMTVKSPDGATWNKKVEVKEYKQTVVRIKHVKADAPKTPDAPKAKAMSYVGTVRNTTNNCKADQQMSIKLEFVSGPDVVKTVEVKAGAKTSVELAEGPYRIRRWQLEGADWVFDKTDEWTVKKDGWTYDWGCTARKNAR